MTEKLKRSERERIIFNHIKGIDDPLYEVSQTKYGKWIVKAKPIEIEEEESINEELEIQPVVKAPIKQPEPKLTNDKQDAKREKRRRNRRAKQDAKRILDALNNLISSNNEAYDELSDEEPVNDQQQYAAQLVSSSNNYNPVPARYQRRVLRFN